MKTLEEKANEAWNNYEYKETPHLYQSCFKDGYIHGATEALASQWRSVKDELPDVEQTVLLFSEESSPSYTTGILTSRRRWLVDDEYMKIDYFTHWMPIPELKTKDNE